MKALLRAAALCLFLASLHAWGDLVLVQSFEVNGTTSHATIKYKGDFSRVDMISGGALNVSTITDIANAAITILLHRTKSVVHPIPRQDAIPGGPPPLTDTGKSEKVGDYTAEIYTGEVPDAKFIYWIARDYPGYAALNEQMKKLRLLEMKTGHIPDLSSPPGMIVKTQITMKTGASAGNTVVVTLLSATIQSVDDSEFQVPADYTERASASTPSPATTPSAAATPATPKP